MTTNFKSARSIRIFLRDGDPRQTRSAEITMSTTQAIGFRRDQLTELGNELQEMIEQPGAYILMDGDDSGGEREAYIGESEDVFGRLRHHKSSKGAKDFWVDTIVLVSKDENLTKSHARFVESRLISEAQSNPRWKLSPNRQTPSKSAGRLPLPDRLDMEKFVTEAKILVGVLGCDVFRTVRVEQDTSTASDQIDKNQPGSTFYLRGKGYDARMHRSSGEFVVEAGSKARKTLAPTTPKTVKDLRRLMEENGDLQQDDSSLLFKSAYKFSSVTTAAGVVCGFSVNGRNAWKDDQGNTYGDSEAE